MRSVDRSIKAQFKYANKLGAQYAVVLGDDELNDGSANIKNMMDGIETMVQLDDIVEFFGD